MPMMQTMMQPGASPYQGMPMYAANPRGSVGPPQQRVVRAGAVGPPPADGKHFKCQANDRIQITESCPQGRYKIVRELGSGCYGRVFECLDDENNGGSVAIKIVRSEPEYGAAAQREINAMEMVGDHPNVAILLCHFSVGAPTGDHICVVQEKIGGGTLFDKLWKGNTRYSLDHTRKIAHQMLCGLAHIHQRSVLHTDIKTDNVMIDGYGSDGCPRIKIVDFGSAIEESDYHPTVISSQEYRAPEVILQAGWSYGADVWAMGVTIIEVLLKHRPFATHMELTLLHMQERTVGAQMPQDMIQRGLAKRKELISVHRSSLALPMPQEAPKINAVRPLNMLIQDKSLLSLLQQMLTLDTARRPLTSGLLRHPFFDQLAPPPTRPTEAPPPPRPAEAPPPPPPCREVNVSAAQPVKAQQPAPAPRRLSSEEASVCSTRTGSEDRPSTRSSVEAAVPGQPMPVQQPLPAVTPAGRRLSTQMSGTPQPYLIERRVVDPQQLAALKASRDRKSVV